MAKKSKPVPSSDAVGLEEMKEKKTQSKDEGPAVGNSKMNPVHVKTTAQSVTSGKRSMGVMKKVAQKGNRKSLTSRR